MHSKVCICLFVLLAHQLLGQKFSSSYEYRIIWPDQSTSDLTITEYYDEFDVTYISESGKVHKHTERDVAYISIQGEPTLEVNSLFDTQENEYHLNPNSLSFDADTSNYYCASEEHFFGKSHLRAYTPVLEENYIRFRKKTDTLTIGRLYITRNYGPKCVFETANECFESRGYQDFELDYYNFNIILSVQTEENSQVSTNNDNNEGNEFSISLKNGQELVVKSSLEDSIVLLNTQGAVLKHFRSNQKVNLNHLTSGLYIIRSEKTGLAKRFLK